MGVGYYELRVLDRYRPRWYADFGDSLPVPSEVAHLDQPLRRSDDLVRRAVRGYLPTVPHRASLARVLLAVPHSQYRFEPLAEFPQSADLGRVRGLDVLHRFLVVLVYGAGSGFGHSARSRNQQDSPGCLRHSEPGLAR